MLLMFWETPEDRAEYVPFIGVVVFVIQGLNPAVRVQFAMLLLSQNSENTVAERLTDAKNERISGTKSIIVMSLFNIIALLLFMLGPY